MNAEQKARWNKIEAAPLISAEADHLFARKLARQNGWSESFVQGAVREYRRFLFLGICAGHPVSPSDAVDQVWHLHLTYTQAYWQVFCPEVLGQAFHHHPSNGGPRESAKFENWYGKTLESYRAFFGEAPPAFWPSGARKAAEDRRLHRRVDTGCYWIVPKPRLGLPRAGWRMAAAAVILLVAGGCSTLGSSGKWEMDGPSFLLFYAALLVGAIIASVQVRRRMTPPPEPGGPAPELSLYETAYLGGGARRVLQALLARLADAGAVTAGDKGTFHAAGELKDPDDPMEQLVRDSLAHGGQDWDSLRLVTAGRVEAMKERLQQLGLLTTEGQAWRGRAPVLVLLGTVLAIGAARVWHGIERNHPGNILILLVFIALTALLFLAQRRFRTRRGDYVIESLQAAYDQQKPELQRGSPAFSGAVVALMVGLFGVSVLAGTPLDSMREKLGPDKSGGCGGGCGSSCGGGCGGCGGCGG